MNTSKIISGLNDLKRDAESHREANGTLDVSCDYLIFGDDEND